MQKKDLSIVDYFQRIKGLADTLAAIGQPLQEYETVSYILAGLNSDFDPLVTSITTRPEPINLTDLYGYLLSYELRLEHNNSFMQSNTANSSVNMATRNNNGAKVRRSAVEPRAKVHALRPH